MAASCAIIPLIILAAAASLASPAVAMPPEWNLPGLPPAWGSGAVGNHRCVPIPSTMRMCAGIGYAEMRLPNMLNHESAKEVQDQTEHWLPLVNTACHREIRVLLCSIYAPVCIKHLPEKSIKPCQTLCEAVKASCLAIMENFGFAWPDMLNCTQFPPEHDLMCIKRSVSLTSVAAQSGDCQACVSSPTYESLVSSYCMNEVVVKTRIDRVSPVAADSAAATAAAATAAGAVSATPARQPQLQLHFKGKLRFFSAGPGRLTKRDRRQLVGGRVGCSCPLLDEVAANPKRRYMLMGSMRSDGSLDVKFIAEWNTRHTPFRKAVRSFRRSAKQKERSLCRGGQRLLRIRPSAGDAGASAGGRVGGRRGGGGGDGNGGRRRKKRKGKKKDQRTGKAAGAAVERKRGEDGDDGDGGARVGEGGGGGRH